MRTSAIVTTLTVLTLAAGCSSGGSEDASGNPDKEKPGSAGGACSYDSPASLIPALKAGIGDDATVHMDMKMSGGGADMTMTGDMQMNEDGMAMDIKSTGAQEFAMIVVDDKYYISETATDPTYTELPAEMAGMMKEQLAATDIRSSFAAFDKGLKAVKSNGRESVDGDKLCSYTLTVDTAEAMKAQGQTTVPTGMPESITYDLLLTDDDQMRRMSFDLGPVAMVMDMTEWNEPVEIKAPPVG